MSNMHVAAIERQIAIVTAEANHIAVLASQQASTIATLMAEMTIRP